MEIVQSWERSDCIVEKLRYRDGALNLFAWIMRPKGPGPFPAVIWNHGSRVRVVYLANEPENARIASVWHWIVPLILAGFGVASVLGRLTWDRDRSWGFRWDSD